MSGAETRTQPVETLTLEEQAEQIRRARAEGKQLPAGRLLGLPELPGEDVWVDTAGLSALTGLSANTITGYLSHGKPKKNPLPAPYRFLYRNYWPLSVIEEWMPTPEAP
jgi:hypothetical protein